jgi:hypothetical protein
MEPQSHNPRQDTASKLGDTLRWAFELDQSPALAGATWLTREIIPDAKDPFDAILAAGTSLDALRELKNAYKMQAEMPNDGEKDEMEADDMLTQQFAEEEGDGDGIHIDIDSHGEDDEMEMDEEEDKALFPASRLGRPDVFAMKRENARMARELATMKAELSAEKFSRELDAMESDGYRIPAERRPRLIAELAASRDPADLIDTWRDLFARDPMGVRIDMSRASLPKTDITNNDISSLVREFAGKPEEFRKAINSRINKR